MKSFALRNVKTGLALLLLVATFCILSACGGSSNEVANTGGISGTGDISKPVIETFDVAHPTYGERSKELSFNLNSLAPVFMLRFAHDVDVNLTDFLEISYSGSGVDSEINNTSNIVTQRSADGKTFYIMIVKTGQVEIGSSELGPGSFYELSIRPKSGSSIVYNEKGYKILSTELYTRNMTFTYPFDLASSDSLVDLGLSPFNGVNTVTPEFIVHSRYPIANFNENESASGYGILDHITVQLNGQSIFKSGLDKVQIWNASSKAFKFLVLPQAGLVRGSEYAFSISALSSLEMNIEGHQRVVTDNDLPQYMLVKTKP